MQKCGLGQDELRDNGNWHTSESMFKGAKRMIGSYVMPNELLKKESTPKTMVWGPIMVPQCAALCETGWDCKKRVEY